MDIARSGCVLYVFGVCVEWFFSHRNRRIGSNISPTTTTVLGNSWKIVEFLVTFVVAVVAESTRVTNGRHKLCIKCALRGCWEHARRIRRQIQNEISRLQLVFFLQSKKKKQFFYFVFGKSFRADWLTSNCWTEMSQWWTKWNLTVWVSMGGKARRYGTTYHSKIWDKQYKKNAE